MSCRASATTPNATGFSLTRSIRMPGSSRTRIGRLGLKGRGRIVSRMLASEVPLGHDGSPKRGLIVSAVHPASHAEPAAEACDVMPRLYRFLIDHGGTNCRLYVQDVASSWTGALLGCWKAETMTTLGRVLDAFASIPEGQTLAGIFASAGPR